MHQPSQEKTIEVLKSPALVGSPVLNRNGQETHKRVAELLQFCGEAKRGKKNFLTHRASSVEYNRVVARRLIKFAETTGVQIRSGLFIDNLIEAAAEVKQSSEPRLRAVIVHPIRKDEVSSKGNFEIPIPIYEELNYLRIFEKVIQVVPKFEHIAPVYVGIPKQLQINELNGVHGVLLFTTDVKGMYFLIGVKKQKVDEKTDKTIVEPVLAFDLRVLTI